MPKIRYIHKDFREKSLALIKMANKILSELRDQGKADCKK